MMLPDPMPCYECDGEKGNDDCPTCGGEGVEGVHVKCAKPGCTALSLTCYSRRRLKKFCPAHVPTDIVPQHQTIIDPKNGNCTEACMATITGIPLEDFPDESHPHHWSKFLTSRGWHMLILQGAAGFWIGDSMPNVPVMMSVASQKYEGGRHIIVVAYVEGELVQVWDPNPGNEPYENLSPATDQWYVLIPHGTMPTI
jgi:hypothetical protein